MRKYLLALAVGAPLLAALPAPAQIAPLSAKQERAANRRALREASRTESPYKDSHLTVTREQLKRGNTEGPPGIANQPRPQPDPRARPSRRAKRRPQTEPAP